MSKTEDENTDRAKILELTTQVVSAYAGNATLSPTELTQVIGTVSRALGDLAGAPAVPAVPAVPAIQELVPAVPIKKSVFPDFIVCLEDGRKLKMLKRHLKAHMA